MKNFSVLKKYCEFENKKHGVYLYKLDCIKFMDIINKRYPKFKFDLIYADPPYFCSNTKNKVGKRDKMSRLVYNKGEWDISKGVINDFKFNFKWILGCKNILKKNGSIFISGTSFNIYSVGFAIQNLDMEILNSIVWYTPASKPLFSCRTFKFDTEFIIWAKKKRSSHLFNYELICNLNKEIKNSSLWSFNSVKYSEQQQGKHVTQKPKSVITKIILASSNEGDWIYDPFNGSATTGVVSINKKRHYVGTELDDNYIEVSKNRLNHAIFHNSFLM